VHVAPSVIVGVVVIVIVTGGGMGAVHGRLLSS
jgi:hypothetical protein